jgi:preprotein translocase SecE subunit
LARHWCSSEHCFGLLIAVQEIPQLANRRIIVADEPIRPEGDASPDDAPTPEEVGESGGLSVTPDDTPETKSDSAESAVSELFGDPDWPDSSDEKPEVDQDAEQEEEAPEPVVETTLEAEVPAEPAEEAEPVEAVEEESAEEPEVDADGVEHPEVPFGEDLEEELPDPGELEIVDDEAEELLDSADEVDETPGEADPDEVEIDDEEQLEEAEAVAKQAVSTRPVKRKLTQAPVKKDRPTPKRDTTEATPTKRTNPVQFVRQSIGELKKVVWPSGEDLGQYFVVVLIFVVVLMMFVFGLDYLFGWGLLKFFG